MEASELGIQREEKKIPSGLKWPQSLVPCTIHTISHTTFSLKSFSIETTKEQTYRIGFISQRLWVWSSFRLGYFSHDTVSEGT